MFKQAKQAKQVKTKLLLFLTDNVLESNRDKAALYDVLFKPWLYVEGNMRDITDKSPFKLQ